MSDDKGNYKLSLKKNTSYNLQVSYIGMSTFSQMLMTKDDDIFKNFSLRSNNQLDAVELTYEMPVVVSGDTLVYDADSFKTGTERKLEDVLKNIREHNKSLPVVMLTTSDDEKDLIEAFRNGASGYLLKDMEMQ